MSGAIEPPPAAPPAGPSPPPAPPEAPPPAPRPWLRPLLRVAQILLVAATVCFLAAYLVRSWASIKDYPWTWDAGWLALSAAAFLLFYLLQTVFWWLLLRGFAVHSPFPVAAATWAKSILARYIPGNVFMYLSRAWLSHAQGLPVDRVTAAMVYEQALGVCSALLAMALLFPFWEYRPGVTGLSLIAIPVLMALLHPRVFAPLSAWALRLLRRPPLDVTLGFAAVLVLLGSFVVSWFVAGVGAWFLARAVTGVTVEALPLVIVANALAYVVGMAAFVFPSGIGVREAVFTASLSKQLPGGVALAWALLLRVWVTVIELAFVGLVVAGEALLRRRKGTA